MSPEIITLEDRLDKQYRRHVYLMSSVPVDYDAPAHAVVERGVEAGMHWMKASWLWREPAPVCVRADGSVRWCMLWGLLPDEHISTVAPDAALKYIHIFKKVPDYVWVRTMPKGVPLGKPIQMGSHDLGLFDAEWVPPGFVAVG